MQEHIPTRQTHVLNVDTMIQIISCYQETHDWKVTLERMIPLRKQTFKAGHGAGVSWHDSSKDAEHTKGRKNIDSEAPAAANEDDSCRKCPKLT